MSCITEILKLKGEQEVFVPVNENGEPWIAVEGGGTYKDYKYLIVLNQIGHRCGYVAIPPIHKYNAENHYDNLNIDCHGGLTFIGRNHDLKTLSSISCDDTWVGFDCGHYGDLVDEEKLKQYFGQQRHKEIESFIRAFNTFSDIHTIKDYDYVETECKHIIDQLIAAQEAA